MLPGNLFENICLDSLKRWSWETGKINHLVLVWLHSSDWNKIWAWEQEMPGTYKNSNVKLNFFFLKGIEHQQVKHNKRMKGRRKGCLLLTLRSGSSEIWGFFGREHIPVPRTFCWFSRVGVALCKILWGPQNKLIMEVPKLTPHQLWIAETMH